MAETESRDELVAIANAMVTFGGSFLQNIGRALLVADTDNVRRIRTAFPEYWDHYRYVSRQIVQARTANRGV